MKKYLTEQDIALLTRIAVLCALALLIASVSPALAATLSRGAEFSTTLSVVRSMIYPLCAIKYWSPPFGAVARRSMDQIISLL